MIRLFFHLLPEILTLPIYITSILGIWLLIATKKKYSQLWVYLFILLFLLGWRIFFHSLMSSTRYSAILIYPGLLLSAFFCLNIKPFIQKVFHNSKSFFCGRVCIAIILTFNLEKIGHIDHYSQNLINIGQAYQFHSKHQQESVFIESKEYERLSHYCGISPKQSKKMYYTSSQQINQISFLDVVNSTLNIPRKSFFIKFNKENALNLLNDDNLKLIGRFYTSKNKNKEIVFYCCEPLCKNICEHTSPLPAIPPENGNRLIDFEQEGRTVELDLQKHAPKKDTEFKKRISLPAGWGIDYNSNNPDPLAIVTLSEANPLAGKQSLLLDASDTSQSAGTYSPPFPIAPYLFELYVRGMNSPKTNLQIQVRCHYGNEGKFFVIKRLFFEIERNKTYKISWDTEEYPADGKNIVVLFYASNGAVLLDQFAIMKN